MTEANRRRTIEQLKEIRDTAVNELRASNRKVGSEWAAERVRAIEHANHRIAKLAAKSA